MNPQGPAREERWQRGHSAVPPEIYIHSSGRVLLDEDEVADYLNALEAERDAYRQALESLFQNGGIGVDGSGHIFLVDEDALVNELVNTAEALALSSAGQNAQQGPVEPAEPS